MMVVATAHSPQCQRGSKPALQLVRVNDPRMIQNKTSLVVFHRFNPETGDVQLLREQLAVAVRWVRTSSFRMSACVAGSLFVQRVWNGSKKRRPSDAVYGPMFKPLHPSLTGLRLPAK